VRPLYETKEHLTVEQKIADRLTQRVKCEVLKLPIRYHLDYALQRDAQIIAFAEIKTTKYELSVHKSYGGFKMSFAKWIAAEQMCRLGRVSFILLVGFPEGIRYLRTNTFEHEGLVWWGRKDRSDAQDMEPAVILSIDRFQPL
jgi:hypothetical protein